MKEIVVLLAISLSVHHARADAAVVGNADVVRACLATSNYISGLATVSLAPDSSTALDRFDKVEGLYADEVKFFEIVAGPSAQSILVHPEFGTQVFLDLALECAKLTVTTCDPGNVAERALMATSALEVACAVDFRGGI